MDRPLRQEFIVVGAKGYPDPVSPWPQDAAYVAQFAERSGGEVRTRWVTEWEPLEAEKVDAERG